MKGILEGVNYIHSKNIIHRDLKPVNIMIKDPNDLNTVKLIDFGLGISKRKATNDQSICGTYTYMAPEVLKNQDYREKVDMWAIGIIMHHVLAGGKHPFHVSGEDPVTFRANLKKLTKVREDPKYFSKLASSLFQRLCAVKVNHRYKANEAL